MKLVTGEQDPSVGQLTEEMMKMKPLPLGRAEFIEWKDRIVKGAMLTATDESQTFALASMLMHIGPTEDHKPDAYFIKALRTAAVKQVAHSIFQEIKEEQDKRKIGEATSDEATSVAKTDEKPN